MAQTDSNRLEVFVQDKHNSAKQHVFKKDEDGNVLISQAIEFNVIYDFRPVEHTSYGEYNPF